MSISGVACAFIGFHVFGLKNISLSNISSPFDFSDSDSEGNTGLTSDDEEDDGDCDTEEYLAALGTRPPLPAKFQAADSMMSPVIQLFCCCTSEDPNERPSAKDIVAALQPEIVAKNVQI